MEVKRKGSIPFWSWNDELDVDELKAQIKTMHEQGISGFIMHARSGLKTEYLGEQWHNCITECAKYARELGMEAWAYDENGWPSGFVGGKLLEDENNRDCEVYCKEGAYDEQALVSFFDDGKKLTRVTKGDSVINVYMRRSASTADILNGEVVDKFIALTHEEYKKRDKYGIMGFFTDEPQYYRWGTPYTTVIEDYFEKKYGESVLDGLGLLFYEREGYRAFRYKYWKGMQELMLENFAKKIYDWCEENGYELTGHYIEERSLAGQMLCCGGIMPFYEYQQFPGVDYLGKRTDCCISPRQLGSVASQLGKKYRLTETFACVGWDATPLELKKIADFQYVAGVNYMCQHLLPYSEAGNRKRDYPAHFSTVNPWIRKGFKDFNAYYTRLTEMLVNSEERVNVGVFQPIRSTYFGWKHEGYKLPEVKTIDDSYRAISEELTKRQITFHYLDETIMARHGKVEGKTLVVGKCKYDYIIFPLTLTMDESSKDLIRKYAENGGKVLLTDGKPEYLEGEKYDYDFLTSTVTLDEIALSQEFKAEKNETVRTSVRVDENGKTFVFATNIGDGTTLKASGKWRAVNPASGKEKICDGEIKFSDGEALLLYPTTDEASKEQESELITLSGEYEVVSSDENYLTLDKIRLSYDGENYGEEEVVRDAFKRLLKERYAGKLYIKYGFKVENAPKKAYFTCEHDQIAINGQIVKKHEKSVFGRGFYRYDIGKYIRKGDNEIVVTLDYYQSEAVYYALFGENVTESLRNCLVYDTEIESGYLSGDFGVFGEYEKGVSAGVLLGDNFKVGKKKSKVTSLIEDGYPFFAGDITLRKKFNAKSESVKLSVPERYQLIEVEVNGESAGVMMFENELDISKFVKKGENDLTITLTVSNRNLLGPFHQKEENGGVGPNSWDNNERRSYALVKTVI